MWVCADHAYVYAYGSETYLPPTTRARLPQHAKQHGVPVRRAVVLHGHAAASRRGKMWPGTQLERLRCKIAYIATQIGGMGMRRAA